MDHEKPTPVLFETPPFKGEDKPQKWAVTPEDYFSPSAYRADMVAFELQKFIEKINKPSHFPTFMLRAITAEHLADGQLSPDWNMHSVRGFRPGTHNGKSDKQVDPFVLRGATLEAFSLATNCFWINTPEESKVNIFISSRTSCGLTPNQCKVIEECFFQSLLEQITPEFIFVLRKRIVDDAKLNCIKWLDESYKVLQKVQDLL